MDPPHLSALRRPRARWNPAARRAFLVGALVSVPTSLLFTEANAVVRFGHHADPGLLLLAAELPLPGCALTIFLAARRYKIPLRVPADEKEA